MKDEGRKGRGDREGCRRRYIGVGKKMGMEIMDEWPVTHRKVARPIREKSTLSG